MDKGRCKLIRGLCSRNNGFHKQRKGFSVRSYNICHSYNTFNGSKRFYGNNI